MREHNFVRKQRNPFKGFVAVGGGPANEFVLAIGPAQEFGRAELANNLPAMTLRDEMI